MKIIEPSYEILDKLDGLAILEKIERIARVCYKSEDRIGPGTAESLVRLLIDRGHEAMLEHYGFSVKFVVDRGVSHELVRHRIASYAMESTRYCSYGNQNEITVIVPSWMKNGTEREFESQQQWLISLGQAQNSYLEMLGNGCSPQEARAVLPNSLKTEIVVTANLREWRHIFKLRTSAAAHPDMRFIMRKLCLDLKEQVPVVFSDINWN